MKEAREAAAAKRAEKVEKIAKADKKAKEVAKKGKKSSKNRSSRSKSAGPSAKRKKLSDDDVVEVVAVSSGQGVAAKKGVKINSVATTQRVIRTVMPIQSLKARRDASKAPVKVIDVGENEKG